MISVPYIAGFFDGEGCISLSYLPRRAWKDDPSKTIKGFRLAVHVSNTEREVLDEIAALYDGTVHPSNRKRPAHHKECFQLQFNGAGTKRKFIEDILPYLIVRKRQAEAALRFLDTMGAPGIRLTEESWTIRLECYNELRKQNQRGHGQGHDYVIPTGPSHMSNPANRFSKEELAERTRHMRAGIGKDRYCS